MSINLCCTLKSLGNFKNTNAWPRAKEADINGFSIQPENKNGQRLPGDPHNAAKAVNYSELNTEMHFSSNEIVSLTHFHTAI